MGKKRKTNKDKEAVVGGRKIKDKATVSQSTAEEAEGDDKSESDGTHLSLDDDDLESMLGETESSGETELASESSETVLAAKLAEFLDNATHKNSSIRLAALKNVQLLLTKHIVSELVEKWKVTLADVIEKSLKRGGQEASTGVKLLSLFALQMGVEVADIVTKLLELVRNCCTDSSLSAVYRADCALALGLTGYLCVDEIDPLQQSIGCLKGVWSGIKSGNTNEEACGLFCNSVAGWALLLQQMNGRRIEEALNVDLPKLCTYFDSNQVEIRIAAGECLAHLYEMGVRLYSDDNYKPPNHRQTLNTLELLSTDSLKYRAKRDRRIQRSNFRQIFLAIKENGSPPSIGVKFAGESLQLDSWSSKLFYDTACQSLRGGMNIHLQKNALLRDMFDLGPPISVDPKLDKLSRAAIQNQVNKARQLHRGKQRDKRLASFSGA